MAHKLIILEWLYKADQDFGFAKLALVDKELDFYDQICFGFQQAAEKYLKAYIVKFDLPFGKEHDLVKLLEVCLKKDQDLAVLGNDCRNLTHFYLETRYADEGFFLANQKDAQIAFESATRIQKVVREKLDIAGEVTKEEIERENQKVDAFLASSCVDEVK